MQALDTNGNGLLDAGDEKFKEFAVWQDKNGNGVTDAGEFKTLTELGIASINLHSNGQVRQAGAPIASSTTGETDVTVMGEAAFTRTDGTTGVVADAMLAFEPGHAAQAEQANINRMALLFNQVVNTATDASAAPEQGLGHVPIEAGNMMIENPQLLAENDMAWKHVT